MTRAHQCLFLKRCRKSDNIWLRALMHSDCLYSSLFFEHYTIAFYFVNECSKIAVTV